MYFMTHVVAFLKLQNNEEHNVTLSIGTTRALLTTPNMRCNGYTMITSLLVLFGSGYGQCKDSKSSYSDFIFCDVVKWHTRM